MSATLSRVALLTCVAVVLSSTAASYAYLPLTTAPTWTHQTGGGAAQFGSVYDGQLYVSDYGGHVRQLDLHTGALQALWNLTPGAYRAYSAPVKANNGNLYVINGDKCLYRLDKTPTPTAVKVADFSSDGSPWDTRVESLGYDSTNDLFFMGTGPYVRAVKPSGALQWTVNRGNFQWGQPMSNDGYLYTFDNSGSNRRIYKYNSSGGQVWSAPFNAWTTNMSKGVDGDGDKLVWAVDWRNSYGAGGAMIAIYDEDGPGHSAGDVKWENRSLGHNIKHASLWEGHNTLVIPGMNGTVEYRSASTGAYLGATPLSGGVAPDGVSLSPWSQVVISGDLAIVSTMHKTPSKDTNHLFVINLNTREEIWKSPVLAGGYASCMIPIVSDGMAIVGTYQSGAAWSAFDLGSGDAYEFSRFANEYNNGQAPGLLKLEIVPGDATGEGYVTGADYTVWATNYDPSGSGATWGMGDWTGDGKVTGADYTVWSALYNTPPPSAVPEPATIGLLAVGAMALIRRRRA